MLWHRQAGWPGGFVPIAMRARLALLNYRCSSHGTLPLCTDVIVIHQYRVVKSRDRRSGVSARRRRVTSHR